MVEMTLQNRHFVALPLSTLARAFYSTHSPSDVHRPEKVKLVPGTDAAHPSCTETLMSSLGSYTSAFKNLQIPSSQCFMNGDAVPVHLESSQKLMFTCSRGPSAEQPIQSFDNYPMWESDNTIGVKFSMDFRKLLVRCEIFRSTVRILYSYRCTACSLY